MSASEAEQGYCVLRTTDERVDVSAVARVAAEVLGRPRFEVAREFRISHGIIARNASEPDARWIVEEVGALGIDVRMIPETDIIPLPEAETAKQIAVGRNGIYFRLGEEDVVVEWEDLALVVAARLGGPQEHVFQRASDMMAGPQGLRRNIASTFDWSTTRRVERLAADLYPRDPWRRLRILEGLVDFRLDGDPERPSTAAHFEELGRQIREGARTAYLNPGADVLGEHGHERVWQRLTFENERLFDAYSFWQVQIAALRW